MTRMDVILKALPWGTLLIVGSMSVVAYATANAPESQVERVTPPHISVIAAKQLDAGYSINIIKVGDTGCVFAIIRPGELGFGGRAYSPSSSVTTLPPETCNGK